MGENEFILAKRFHGLVNDKRKKLACVVTLMNKARQPPHIAATLSHVYLKAYLGLRRWFSSRPAFLFLAKSYCLFLKIFYLLGLNQ